MKDKYTPPSSVPHALPAQLTSFIGRERGAGLPVQLTSFIGREREIEVLRDTLRATRLLTLTGAGGSGKTRLALEVAARALAEHEDGVIWTELAALSDPQLLPQHMAAALGIREEAGRLATGALLDALRSRTLLIVLDNCEHLADACAALTNTLLRECAGLTVLATSREALGVAGERAWLVPPLSLPDDGADADHNALRDAESVQLFVMRAQDAAPSFELHAGNAASVAQICRRLDGIPLAIELAAARVKLLTPEQIAQRLDSAFKLLTSASRTALPRHRTLRATIDWSYHLLTEAEQLLLERLSVFAGGFTLEAAEQVCVDGRIGEAEVLDLLARLVDRSLVMMREHGAGARYYLLDTVRQYAAERLAQDPDAEALQRRHAEFFLDCAEAAAPRLYQHGSESEWFDKVDAEIGNLRTAADWLEATAGCADAALRLAIALKWYWVQRDYVEGRQRLRRGLERDDVQTPLLRAHALLTAGFLAFQQGDLDAAHAPLAEAIPVLREHGDRPALADALCYSGLAKSISGEEQAGGWAMLTDALRIAREQGGIILCHVASAVGYAALRRGNYAQARVLLEDSLQLAYELQFTDSFEVNLGILARAAYGQGDLSAAIVRLRESLVSRPHARRRIAMPLALDTLACVVAAQGDYITAATILGGAELARERQGSRLQPWSEDDRPAVERMRAALGSSAFDRAFAAGRAQSLDQVVEYALAATMRDQQNSVALDAGAVAPVRPTAGSASPALRVHALGPLVIECDGEPLPAAAWPYARPRELLLFLLAHPDGRTREQIGAAFWPESSAAQVKNSFHVTLHHLRKALGHADWVVFENERYRISPSLTVEFDALVFERGITDALRAARTGHGSSDALRTALALYRGDLLADESAGDWHLELRDRLRLLCVDGLAALGELLVREERYAEAMKIYQRVVLMEDLREDAHRRLMQCLAQTGERGRAVRHYERLVALLRDELDAEPEAETVALFESIRRGVPA